MCTVANNDDEVEQAIRNELEETVRKSEYGEIISSERHPLGYNCVSYVRANTNISFPDGMWDLEDKKKIINAHKPVKGAIAITKESKYGHLALVVDVFDDSILIEEGNYISGYKTVRKLPKDFPVGYRI